MRAQDVNIILIALALVVPILYSVRGDKSIPAIPPLYSIALSIFMVVVVTLTPWGGDQMVYANVFEHINFIDFERDIGWSIITLWLYKLTQGDVYAYFFIILVIYTSMYYLFARKMGGKEYQWYFLVFIFGALGYYSGATNVLRTGLAASIFMVSICYRHKMTTYLALSVLAVSIHKSMLLPIGVFALTYLASSKKVVKYAVIFWLVMLWLSVTKQTADLKDWILDNMVDIDPRITSYISQDMNLASVAVYRKAGFRADFVVYSVFPMLVAWYYTFILRIADKLYCRCLLTYIIVNALWLTIIEIPYSDRFAYLSWVLMPILLIYPAIKRRDRISRVVLIMLMLIPMGVNLILSMR